MTEKSIVPRLMDGGRIFIIGGGFSVASENLKPLKQTTDIVIGVNSAYVLGDFVDITFFLDCRWFDWNKEGLKDYKGMLFSACNRCQHGHDGTLIIKRGGAQGINENPGTIAPNRSSGASAINLAYHFGATEIILIGFDMKTTNGLHNFHDLHGMTPPEDVYKDLFIHPFYYIAKDAKKLGVKIWNASMGSALKYFTKKPLPEFFGE